MQIKIVNEIFTPTMLTKFKKDKYGQECGMQKLQE